MRPRIELQNLLERLLGSTNVYFQPPESIKMKFPCVVYQRISGDTRFGDNMGYMFTPRYQVTRIGKESNPEDFILEMSKLPRCIYDRHFVVDNLHHDNFYLYW